MKGSFYILVDGAKVPVIRNPYERIITMYRESWDWCGLEKWLEKQTIESQADLYVGEYPFITLETWEGDSNAFVIAPGEKSIQAMAASYSTDYTRWYSERLKKIVAPIVEPDLLTFGYTF